MNLFLETARITDREVGTKRFESLHRQAYSPRSSFLHAAKVQQELWTVRRIIVTSVGISRTALQQQVAPGKNLITFMKKNIRNIPAIL